MPIPNPFKQKQKRTLSKRDRIKHIISSIVKFRILKRPSLTKVKIRISVFLGSIILTISMAFNVCPAYAALTPIKTQPLAVRIAIRRDILMENKIISRTITENIFSDGILAENTLFEQGLRHIVETEKIKTEETQLKKHSKKFKKPNRQIHTIFDLLTAWRYYFK